MLQNSNLLLHLADLFGPVEGRRHDSGILDYSGLLRKFQQDLDGPNGNL